MLSLRTPLPLLFLLTSAASLQALWFDCSPPTMAEAYEEADAVFLGKPTRVVVTESAPGDWPHTVYQATIELIATWKTDGETFPEGTVVVRSDGMDYCSPTYAPNYTWLIYARKSTCDGAEDTGEPCADYHNGVADGSRRVAHWNMISDTSVEWIESLGPPDQILDGGDSPEGLSAFKIAFHDGSYEYLAPPFGRFMIYTPPWYHWETNGWVHISEFNNDAFWWYDQAADGWFYTSAGSYPWIYHDLAGWVYLDTSAETPAERVVYSPTMDEWLALDWLPDLSIAE